MEIDADVVCLQEVLASKYNLIKQYVRTKYLYIYPGNITNRYDSIILSKTKIINSCTHNFKYTNMNRNLKIITTSINNQHVIIATTHFESEFNNQVNNKLYQYYICNRILHNIYNKTKLPVFLCADTNICDYTEKHFMNIFGNNNKWKDGWIETGSNKTKEITFNSKTNPILLNRYKDKKDHKYMSRLDRILHISYYNAIEFNIIDNNNTILSDHSGISCTFNNKYIHTDTCHYKQFVKL
jgi:endonuclease/exonuclease/phosphatase family metal-dependent hydrolase